MATLRPFQSTNKKSTGKSTGFTLIETLVVITIVGVLSSILVGYSRQSGKIIALTSTEAKFLSLFSRAKFLSIETFFDQLDNPPTEKRISMTIAVILIFSRKENICRSNIRD